MDMIQDLFSTYPFMPHKHCFNAEEGVLWMHVIGDIITALAYYTIPLFLAYFVWKKKDLRYKGIFWLFAAFILSCGTTHILAIIGMWEPYYRLEGLVKLGTGLVSIVTAIALVPIIPMALKLPSSRELKEKNEELSETLNMLERSEKETQKSNELLKAAQQLAKLGSWEWILETDKLICSDEFFRIMDSEELIGTEISNNWFLDKVHPDDIERVQEHINSALTKGNIDIRFRVNKPNKNVCYLHSKGRVQYDHFRDPVSIIGTTLDITKQVQDEVALREHSMKMEETNKYLKRIAYATSHDLKEPLRGIVSYSQLVLKVHEEELSYDAKDKLHFVVDEGKRMNKMIESLLSFSKIESMDPELIEVDMNSIMVEVLQRFRVSIEETNAYVEVNDLPTIKADKEQMNIIMRNLVGNALKFSQTEPKIRISAVKVGPEWEFRVEDNGIGFSKQFNEEIFGLFKTLESKSGTSGSGIGLSLCKTIVQAHGGRIWAISKEGKGSTFHFTLPASA